MKNLLSLKNTLKLAFVASALFFTSCGDDNSILDTDLDPLDPTTTIPTVIVNATNASNTSETQYSTTATAGSMVTVVVNFSVESSARNMERLYITKSELNSTEGPVPYDITLGGAIEGISTKSDGSIDLDDDHKESLNFSIDFPAPDTANGTVQYVIWATKQRGDFRDLTDDNVYGDDTPNYAVITIGEGKPVGYVEFSQTILAAPLADLNSNTFISVFNGETYKIKDGVETSALWDFGYYYGSEANFYSTQQYSKDLTFFKLDASDDNETPNKSVADISGVDQNSLNKFFFSKTSSLNFDNVDSADDLDVINAPNSEKIEGINVNDVIEFIDAYGNKGLIKVTELEPGFGFGDYVKFDVKAQSNIIPLKQ